MIQSQHAVRLTAAKCRFELNHRLSILAADTTKRLHQQSLHAVGHIRSREKFHRISILIRTLSAGDLRQIGCELRVFIATVRHIGMRLNHISPAGKPIGRRLLHNTDRLLCRFHIGAVARCRHGPQLRTICHFTVQRLNFRLRIRINPAHQQGHGIQYACSFLICEILSIKMRPIIACRLNLADPRTRRRRQFIAKQIRPVCNHQPQTHRHIHRILSLVICLVGRQFNHVALVSQCA